MEQASKSFLDYITQYGLGNVLAVFLALGFWRVLIYVLKENSKREERLAGIVENHLSGLNMTISSVGSNVLVTHNQLIELKDANRLQREEHKEMIEVLRKMSNELSLLAKERN